MELDFSFVFSSMLIGTVGLGLLIYGKKAGSLKCLGMGIAMSVFPFFVHSVIIMWLLAGACLLALAGLNRMGY